MAVARRKYTPRCAGAKHLVKNPGGRPGRFPSDTGLRGPGPGLASPTKFRGPTVYACGFGPVPGNLGMPGNIGSPPGLGFGFHMSCTLLSISDAVVCPM